MTDQLPTGDDELAVEVPDDDEGRTPAAPGSVRASLAERRRQAAQSLHLDLEVPRITPPVYVRYAPIPAAKITATYERLAKLKKSNRPDAEVVLNAAVLADACVGIFEVIDGVEVSALTGEPHDEWPKFGDRDFAAALDKSDARTAADVVRALYLTDGDIISTVGKVTEWSGYAAEQDERDDEGN